MSEKVDTAAVPSLSLGKLEVGLAERPSPVSGHVSPMGWRVVQPSMQRRMSFPNMTAGAIAAQTQAASAPPCPQCGEAGRGAVHKYMYWEAQRTWVWVCSNPTSPEPERVCGTLFAESTPMRACPLCADAPPAVMEMRRGILGHYCPACSIFFTPTTIHRPDAHSY